MPTRQKIDKKTKKLLIEYFSLDGMYKEAASAFNKHKTILRNHIKSLYDENDYPAGSYFSIDGRKLSYATAVSEKIAVEDLLEMLEEGQITREQFSRCVNVQIGETKNVLGGDVVTELTQPVPGKTPDIRVEKLPIDQQDDEFLFVPDKPRVKRRKFGKKGTLTGPQLRDTETQSTRPRRTLRINRRR